MTLQQPLSPPPPGFRDDLGKGTIQKSTSPLPEKTSEGLQ